MADKTQAEREAEVEALIARAADPNDPYDAGMTDHMDHQEVED